MPNDYDPMASHFAQLNNYVVKFEPNNHKKKNKKKSVEFTPNLPNRFSNEPSYTNNSSKKSDRRRTIHNDNVTEK